MDTRGAKEINLTLLRVAQRSLCFLMLDVVIIFFRYSLCLVLSCVCLYCYSIFASFLLFYNSSSFFFFPIGRSLRRAHFQNYFAAARHMVEDQSSSRRRCLGGLASSAAGVRTQAPKTHRARTPRRRDDPTAHTGGGRSGG